MDANISYSWRHMTAALNNKLDALATCALGWALLFSCGCQSPLRWIPQSHIDANIPDKERFDGLLTQTLVEYLSVASKSEIGGGVQYELLRNGPTQVGIGYPKYYLWAKAFDSKRNLVTEGALRVAAINREAFHVTDFLSKTEIVASPENVSAVFPKALNERIFAFAGVKAKPLSQ